MYTHLCTPSIDNSMIKVQTNQRACHRHPGVTTKSYAQMLTDRRTDGQTDMQIFSSFVLLGVLNLCIHICCCFQTIFKFSELYRKQGDSLPKRAHGAELWPNRGVGQNGFKIRNLACVIEGGGSRVGGEGDKKLVKSIKNCVHSLHDSLFETNKKP